MRVVIGAGLNVAGLGDAVVVDVRGCVVVAHGRAAGFAMQTVRIIAGIAAAAGGWVRRDDLINGLWGDDADGGPLRPENVLAVLVVKASYALASIGLRIECSRYDGYRLVEVGA